MAATLLDLLQENMIELNIAVENWEEALQQGAQLLIEDGGVEPRYLDAMIAMVKELGPYVVIAPGLALGHAGPDKGVKRTCFSLVTLKTPVNFGVPVNDPVDVVFSFAAPNKEEHMQALRDLALFCSEEKNLAAIRAATEKKQVRDLLIKFFN
ncbi:MAG: PTS transporter subunit EIIA [Chloroflexi bacterium]|nr:PTS transporter subunit EIIA [Chloroflexota bacterium]